METGTKIVHAFRLKLASMNLRYTVIQEDDGSVQVSEPHCKDSLFPWVIGGIAKGMDGVVLEGIEDNVTSWLVEHEARVIFYTGAIAAVETETKDPTFIVFEDEDLALMFKLHFADGLHSGHYRLEQTIRTE